jgi:hypothetical protein
VKPYEKLQNYWLGLETRIMARGTSEADLVSLEQKYKVQLPCDFREYLFHISPALSQMDDNGTAFWPLGDIKNIPDEHECDLYNETVTKDAHHYLFFADFAIWSMAWAIACGEDNRGRVIVVSGETRFVADSFGEFVDRYIENVNQLL